MVTSIVVDRHSDSLIGGLHRKVLSTEAWSLEALGLDEGKGTHRSESFSKTTDFSEDSLKVEVHDTLGSGSELDLAIICGDSLSARMSGIKIEVLMMVNK